MIVLFEYVNRDWNTVGEESSQNLSSRYDNPSLNPSLNYPDIPDISTDFTKLGFILSASPTGSELITLKARTYLYGKKSVVSVARFKVARDWGDTEFIA